MDTKQCPKCTATKAVDAFARNRGRASGRDSWCRQCQTEAHLRRRYGFTASDVEALLAAQGGACAICASPDPGGSGTFCIDHDHACCPGRNSCGACLRGLLCHNCNRGLGSLQDSPEVLVNAAGYLLKHARSR